MAAIFNSTQLAQLATDPVAVLNATFGGAKIYYRSAEGIVPASGAVADDVYDMLDLPVGAILLPHLSYLVAEDMGTDVDAEVYLGTTPVLAATAVDAAATATQLTPALQMTPLTAKTRMSVKLVSGGGGTAFTAGKKMQLQVAYCMQGG